MSRPQTPFGYTIFCDDIRQEVGGKTTYIGAYSGFLVLEVDFPVTIPMLCMAVNFVIGMSDELRPLSIKAYFDPEEGEEALLIEGDVPIEGFKAVDARLQGMDNMNRHAAVHIKLAPFNIEKAGRLKVRAYYGDEEYRLGSLIIVRGPWSPNAVEKGEQAE